MKNFNIADYDEYNLVVQVGAKTYTDDYVKLEGFTSYKIGGTSTTTGQLTVRGNYHDYIYLLKAETVNLYLKINGIYNLYSVALAKNPVEFKDNSITLTLDTIPNRAYIGCTDGRGNDLPFSFGKANVKAVNVSQRYVGTALESIHAVREEDIISIFDCFAELNQLLARSSVLRCATNLYYSGTNLNILDYVVDEYNANTIDTAGKTSTSKAYRITAAEERKHIGTFLQKIVSLSQRDSRTELYDSLYDLLNWRGTGKIETSNNGLTQVIDYTNLLPVISYGILRPDRLTLVTTNYTTFIGSVNVDSSVGAAYYGFDPAEIADWTYRNMRTNEEKTYSQLLEYYRDLITELLTPPSTLRVDLPYIENGTTLSLRASGQYFTGYYSDGVLSDISFSAKPCNIFFTRDGAYNIKIDSNLWFEGKYIKIIGAIPYVPQNPTKDGVVYLGAAAEIVYTQDAKLDCSWVAQVVKQREDVLTLNIVPYYSVVEREYDVFNQPIGDNIKAMDLILEGQILAYADTLTHDLLDYRLLEIKDSVPCVVAIKYWYGTVNGEGAYYGFVGLVNQRQAYDGIVKEAYQDTTYLKEKKWCYTRLDENLLNSDIAIQAGSSIEFGSTYQDVYIVDCRPNITITSVKCKRGEMYAEVPSSYYDVEYNYAYLGHPLTALVFRQPLDERNEEWISTDVVVQVDAPYVNPVEVIGYLATYIGKTATAPACNLVSNFTVYGQKEVLPLIRDIAVQGRLGFFISNTTLKLTDLSVAHPAVATINTDSYSNFSVSTTDSLEILTKASYTHNSLHDYNNTLTYTQNNAKTRLFDLKYDCYIYNDESNSATFSTWHFNFYSRNWLRMTVEGFTDSVNLEPYDFVNISAPHIESIAMITEASYDHEEGTVNLTLLLPIDMHGSSATFDTIVEDFIVQKPSLWYGYV